MRRFSFHKSNESPVSPVTPWEDGTQAISPRSNEASPQTPAMVTLPRRMFGRNGVYGNGMTTPDSPTLVEEPPIPLPYMSRTAALRLSKRAELLDKRANVHHKHRSQLASQNHVQNQNQYQSEQYQRQYQQHPLQPVSELEGTIPVIHELEGDRPVLPELEGSTPDTALTAVPARVVAAGAVKAITVKAKRASLKLFPSFRPEKTHYSVECSSAAEEVARAEREAEDKKFFADQVNRCRKYKHLTLLELDDELSGHAQQHADNLPSRADSYSMIPPTSPAFYNRPLSPNAPHPDTVTTVASPLDRRSTVARIISERGIGAMACVERWNSGQYRRHAMGVVDPERHQDDCPCKLDLVYETMMNRELTKIGVGRATEDGSGIWVMELAA